MHGTLTDNGCSRPGLGSRFARSLRRATPGRPVRSHILQNLSALAAPLSEG